jgi:hypothetical protein
MRTPARDTAPPQARQGPSKAAISPSKRVERASFVAVSQTHPRRHILLGRLNAPLASSDPPDAVLVLCLGVHDRGGKPQVRCAQGWQSPPATSGKSVERLALTDLGQLCLSPNACRWRTPAWVNRTRDRAYRVRWEVILWPCNRLKWRDGHRRAATAS